MKDFCIIGSGISGATIASILSKKYSLDIYDKARGAGGRSSNKKFINALITKKIVKTWQGKHIFLNTNKKEDKKHLKIIGNKGNNSISKYLLKNINCTFNSELVRISNKDKVWVLDFSDGTKKFYKSLILTCPFPQLKKLAKKYIELHDQNFPFY